MSEQDIPKMMEITSQGTPDTAEGMEKSLEEELEAFPSYRKYMYEMCDMGYWVLEEKESGTIVGRAGVEPKIWNHNSSVVELGYLIDEKHRRKGFAYEACRGILEPKCVHHSTIYAVRMRAETNTGVLATCALLWAIRLIGNSKES